MKENRTTLKEREVCEYLGVGRNTARQIGIDSGAVRRIGRRVLYDRKAIDAYIDSQK